MQDLLSDNTQNTYEDYLEDEHIIDLPHGPLYIELFKENDTSECEVYLIDDLSPIKDKIFLGDIVLSLNGHELSKLTINQICNLFMSTSCKKRRLVILRPISFTSICQ